MSTDTDNKRGLSNKAGGLPPSLLGILDLYLGPALLILTQITPGVLIIRYPYSSTNQDCATYVDSSHFTHHAKSAILTFLLPCTWYDANRRTARAGTIIH